VLVGAVFKERVGLLVKGCAEDRVARGRINMKG